MKETTKKHIPNSLTTEQAAEYFNCYHDPLYFAENYIKITGMDGELQDLYLHPHQRTLLQNFALQDRHAILKDRQTGITLVCLIYALWIINFHPDKRTIMVVHAEDYKRPVYERIMAIHNNLPDWMRMPVCMSNKLPEKFAIRLENGSLFLLTTILADAIESEQPVDAMFFDEFVFHRYVTRSTMGRIYSYKKSPRCKAIIYSSQDINMGIFTDMIESKVELERMGVLITLIDESCHQIREGGELYGEESYVIDEEDLSSGYALTSSSGPTYNLSASSTITSGS